MEPDFLVVGHVVKDITPNGWQPGGSVAYATLQASRLGLSTAAVTACGPDINPAEDLPWASWEVVPSADTTTFANVYEDGRRSQEVLARAPSLSIADIPEAWRTAPIVLLAPVMGEIKPCGYQDRFAGATLGLSAQGWLRDLHGANVSPAPFSAEPPWLEGNVVFVSDEDLDKPERAAEWVHRVPIVVLTHGWRGCTVWTEQGSFQVGAFSTPEVDPTGAGDAFAAAFLVRLHETKDPVAAAHFASAAGSLAVRAHGLDGIGDRSAIESLLEAAVIGRR
jgi:sugar/nucleoside kinase (ribokinase family)